MKAVVITDKGGPEVLTVAEIDEPDAGPGDVTVSVAAAAVNPVDIVPGMILTIEPGHYVAGRYGIRIENQVEVVEEADGFLSFTNLSWAPIQTDMLDLGALTADERAWLVSYNAAILTHLGPQLSDAARDWIIANGKRLTAPDGADAPHTG